MLDIVSQGVFTVDRTGRITSFNRAAEQITGYRQKDLLGRPCTEIFRTDICDKSCPLRESIYRRQRIENQQVVIHTCDGRTVPILVATAPLVTDEGQLLGGAETFIDLSHIKHLERKLDDKYCFESIVSRSPAMLRILEILPLVAQSNSTVLITGASGTGKELIARGIHNQSRRGHKPFVAVNCAAVPETLMESELFGYKRGAFTDAKQDKPGRIAQADGGTLFLDEVGDLPLSLQVKLLRFLEERSFDPLGARQPVRVDVRVIAATNRDLEFMVKQGSFRNDLFYRLNVLQISLPPLSERSEDIPLLVRHFIQRFRASTGKPIQGIEDRALAALLHYHYRGNIRELENIIERAFILCEGGKIDMQHLPAGVVRGAVVEEPKPWNRLDQVERDAIVRVLKKHNGNRSRAAAELGVHRTTLLKKIKKYDLFDTGRQAAAANPWLP